MTKRKKRILTVSIALVVLLSVSITLLIVFLGKSKKDALGGNNDENSISSENDIYNEKTDDNVFIKDSKALFNIVYTSNATFGEIECANAFAQKLRSLGVEVSNPIADSDENISDCEIIFGTGAERRGENCNIPIEKIGVRGYTLKSVGKRVIVASGSDEFASVAYEKLLSDVFFITSDTTSLFDFSLQNDVFIEQLTEYSVKSISISGFDLSAYKLLIDIKGMENFENSNIKNFKYELFSNTGYNLSLYSENENLDRCFIVRHVRYAGDGGFRVYIEDSNFIIECAYGNAFDKSFEKFINESLFTSGDIVFDNDYSYKDEVSSVYYSDFGAKGDGIADDYLAIYKAHEYANMSGQTVYADKDAKYRIEEMTYGSIPVKTDVYLGDAKIITKNRVTDGNLLEKPLFFIEGEKGLIYEDLDENLVLNKDQAQASWISDFTQNNSMIKVCGKNEGVDIVDVFIIKDGDAVDENSPISYNFSEIDKLQIYKTTDKPIVFSGGVFESTGEVTEILVRRSNVGIDGIEVKISEGSKENEVPFVDFSLSYNCTLINTEVSVSCHDCIDIKFKGAGLDPDSTEKPFVLLSGAKNVEISDMNLSALDASDDVFGLKVFRTNIYSPIKLNGGNYFEAENVNVLSGDSFVVLTKISGASFCGDIKLKNSKIDSIDISSLYVIKSEYDSGDEEYSSRFGYSLHMPNRVILDNFTHGDEYATVYLFSYIENSAFENNKYRICSEICYENMHTINTYKSDGSESKLAEITIYNKTYPDESSE